MKPRRSARPPRRRIVFDLLETIVSALSAPVILVPKRAPVRAARTNRSAGSRRWSGSTTVQAAMLIAAAALIAGTITVFTATEQVEASAFGTGHANSSIGPRCSQQEWPYYEPYCLRDLRPLGSGTRMPRIVRIDRIPAATAANGSQR